MTTPSLHVSELKPPPHQYELQQYPAAPDVPGQPVKEVSDPAYPLPGAAPYPTGYPHPPPKY